MAKRVKELPLCGGNVSENLEKIGMRASSPSNFPSRDLNAEGKSPICERASAACSVPNREVEPELGE
jgi:hypothetical protein